MASFTPLVFSTVHGIRMSGCTNIFYKRLGYRTTVWHDSVVTSASHFCDQLLPVYRKHHPTVIVWPTMVHLTWLWLRVKCVIMLIRCIFSPFLCLILEHSVLGVVHGKKGAGKIKR